MGRVRFADLQREERRIGGQPVSVVVAPRFRPRGRLRTAAGALHSLLSGMRVTLGYLVRPSTVVTRQYPENRATLRFPERYRARLRLIYDENGYHRCNACRLCEKACPNASITITSRAGSLTKVELDRYVWRLDSCTFCNACVLACPSDALEMTPEFENAVMDRRLLIFTLNRYAGPSDKFMAKEEDPARRTQAMDPRDPYGGEVPLNGASLPGVTPLGVTPLADPPRPAASPARQAAQ
ncbi:MAG: 4Fe-4S dicluster domain-containing protein [Candidatus Latescibacterota bacterium]